MTMAGFISLWDLLSVILSSLCCEIFRSLSPSRRGPLSLALGQGPEETQRKYLPHHQSPAPLLLSLCLGRAIKVSEGLGWVLCLMVNYGYCSQGTPERARWVCSWNQDEREGESVGRRERAIRRFIMPSADVFVFHHWCSGQWRGKKKLTWKTNNGCDLWHILCSCAKEGQ